jgi:hypothetical protein
MASRVQLLVKAVQAMDVAFGLGTDGAKLEAHSSGKHAFSKFNQALLANVLQRVLQTGKKVRDELGHRTSVED